VSWPLRLVVLSVLSSAVAAGIFLALGESVAHAIGVVVVTTLVCVVGWALAWRHERREGSKTSNA
jgi:hypothetical protein